MARSNILMLINNSNGWISFDKFMYVALYGKGCGYYNKPLSENSFGPFGAKGDFITAPMMGPWLAKTLAQNFIDLTNQAPNYLKNKLNIREIGAGTGDLAADILIDLDNYKCLPKTYEIIEINKSMTRLQKKVILNKLENKSPDSSKFIFSKIKWRSNFIDEKNYFDCENYSKISGMVIANELLDSFPTKIFKFVPSRTGGLGSVLEYGVSIDKDQVFLCTEKIASAELHDAVAQRFGESVQRGYPWNSEKFGEWCPYIPKWCNQVMNKIDWGQLYIIDYGKERYELDYPTRVESTITTYRNHNQFTDLDQCIKNPGHQDITAQVDFTAIVDELSKLDRITLEIKTQAAWMLDSGVLELAEKMFFLENKKLSPRDYNLLGSLQNQLSDATMGQSFLVLSAKKFSN